MSLIPLYIHIPFCRKKCNYCTFYSLSNQDPLLHEKYIHKLIQQIDFYVEKLNITGFNTVYIGGGTPSLLHQKALSQLLDYIDKKGNGKILECTIECNPEDIDKDFLSLLNDSPVNRISLGMQSFQNTVLHNSGREFSETKVDQSIQLINKYWDNRFSIDLITGLPGQTIPKQIEDVERAVASGVDHISCYSLILDENTPISKSPLLPSEEEEGEMWHAARDVLFSKGFNHYEISNFSLPGNESLHNMQYWQMNPFLGCGPGAVGMIRDDRIQRITNIHSFKEWMKRINFSQIVELEEISPRQFLFESFMMGLRTEKGIDRKVFKDRFLEYPEHLISRTIKGEKAGSFRLSSEYLSLNDESRLFMNPILLKIDKELDDLQKDFTVLWP